MPTPARPGDASMPTRSRPGDRWRQGLADRDVPQDLADSAPEPPPSLEPESFRWRPEEDAHRPVRPSRRRALEALPDAGSVLDVGVGGGASSLGLAPRVGSITGVDRMPEMLELFEASALAAGVAPRAVLGAWPDVADDVEPVDVAVCHHAIYGVAEIEDFVVALTTRARRRVVIELSGQLPQARFDPLWKLLHGIDRAHFSVAEEVHAVLAAMGLAVQREDIVLPANPRDVTTEFVAFARRRLFVGPEKDPEIEQFLRAMTPEPMTVVALWWPGAA
ncbi:MAG: class I SAM-dependent methyltransferase [Mycobacteriales bacterium]